MNWNNVISEMQNPHWLMAAGGVLLADRSLSRLLKRDWPRTLEELEELKRR